MRIVNAAWIAGILALTGSAIAAPKPSQASFDLKMPCTEPARSTATNGKLNLTCDSGDAFYMFIVDLPDEGAVAEDVYTINVENLAKALHGKARSTGPITANGLSGRETFYDSGPVAARSRNFIAKGLFYVLTYYGPAGTENSQPVLGFFGSFQLKP